MSDPMLAKKSDESSRTDEPRVDELTQARERLNFYNSFDAIIHENIQRSGDLLRLVADERERNERELVAMRHEVGRRLATQQQILQTLAASLDAMQGSLAAITDQVGSALAQLEPERTPSVTPGAGRDEMATGSAALPAAAHVVDQDIADVDSSGTAARGAAGVVSLAAAPTMPFGSRTGRSAPVLPALAPGDAPTANIVGTDETPETDPTEQQALPMADEMPGGTSPRLIDANHGPSPEPSIAGPAVRHFDLIIRGVPRAAAALAIQRYLQDQPTIRAVEVREYVAGVLRFQLEAVAIEVETLTGWAATGADTILATGDQVVELQYHEPRPDGEA